MNLKTYRNTLWAAVAFFWVTACGGPATQQEQGAADGETGDEVSATTGDTPALTGEEPIDHNSTGQKEHYAMYTEDFRKLIINFDGVMRQVELFKGYKAISELESARENVELVDEMVDERLVFKVTLSEDEKAEITYKFENDALTAMQCFVYMQTQEEHDQMLKFIEDFFTFKYGSPEVTEDRGEVWKISEEHEVDLIDHSTETNFKFEIDLQ